MHGGAGTGKAARHQDPVASYAGMRDALGEMSGASRGLLRVAAQLPPSQLSPRRRSVLLAAADWVRRFEALAAAKAAAYALASDRIGDAAVQMGLVGKRGTGDGAGFARVYGDDGDEEKFRVVRATTSRDDGEGALSIVAARDADEVAADDAGTGGDGADGREPTVGSQNDVATQLLRHRVAAEADEIRGRRSRFGYRRDDADPASAAAEAAASHRRPPASARGAGALLGALVYALRDAGVQVMLLLKLTRLAVQVGALFVAQKVFSEAYVRAMYAEGSPEPPELRGMLFMFLSVDATAQLVITLLVVLASYVYKTDANSFALDDEFVATLLGEYFISTVVLLVFGLLFAAMLKRKRYFHYPDQGGAVSSAYRDLLVGVCAVSACMPYSALL
jgi:hypothetical protein